MATRMLAARSGVLGALRWGRSKSATGPLLPSGKRNFAASAHDEAYESAKWEKITYAGIVSSTIYAVVILSKGHPHYEEPPAYPYLHIRNKEFPWVGSRLASAAKERMHFEITMRLVSVWNGVEQNIQNGGSGPSSSRGPDGLFETKRHGEH